MRTLSALLALVLLASCAPGPAGSFADMSSPAYRMKSYYERNARERLDQCSSVIFEDVLQLEVLEETAEQQVLEVRYAYSDWGSSGRTVGGCQGFATRVFTLAKTADGPRVIEMSDPIS